MYFCTTFRFFVSLAVFLFAMLVRGYVESPPCTTDLDCSLNGKCEETGRCTCYKPWTDNVRGDAIEPCSVLVVKRHPDSYVPAYGGGPVRKSTAYFEQSLTSWGGNVLFDKRDGLYHLFVSAMGEGKGLKEWGSVSEIHHATASNPMDAFIKKDVALQREAHNASPIRARNGSYLLFHIGGKTHVSAAESPFGPWRSVTFDAQCNNPAPAVHPNGTAYVFCNNGDWVLLRSDDVFAGHWTPVQSLNFPPSWGGESSPYLRNEDPYLYFDARGNWHLLGHRYDYRDGWPVNPNQTMPILVSGHAFSVDGMTWYYNSAQQPFDAAITFANGTTQYFSTFERPHLLFDDPDDRTPTHLIVAAQPYFRDPSTQNICQGCESRVGSNSSCVVCKTTSTIDYTYTLSIPLG